MQIPNIFTSFLPNIFLTIFLVKSKLSTAKKSKTPTFSRVFHPHKNRQFSREIKVEFLVFERCVSITLKLLLNLVAENSTFPKRTMRTTTIVLAFALVVIGTIMQAEPTSACWRNWADYEYGERYSKYCCGKTCSVTKTGRNGGRLSDVQSCCDSACASREAESRRRERRRNERKREYCKRNPC